MNISEVKNYVKKDLASFLKSYSFKYDAKAYSYLKETQSGSIGVISAMSDYSPLFKLGFVFTIRINAVEDVYNEFGRVSPPYQKYSSTIMIQYDYFKNKKYFDYHFYNQSELAFALKDFKELFGRDVYPLLQQRSTIADLKELIHFGSMSELDTSENPDNLIHWLIVEKLSGVMPSQIIVSKLKDYCSITEVKNDKIRIDSFLKYMGLE